MLRNHPATEAIKGLLKKPALAPQPSQGGNQTNTVLDSAKDPVAVRIESVLDAAGGYQDNDIALKAVAAVQEWAETPPGDLDAGERSGDRLFSLLAGIADADMDGEISEDEASIVNQAANAAADYMIAKGVPESDAVTLLSDFDNDLAETVQDLVLSAMPDGDDAAEAEIDEFVFGDGSDESAMDAVAKAAELGVGIKFNDVVLDAVVFASLAKKPDWMQMSKADVEDFKAKATEDPKVLDAVYKKKVVVRRGKKIRVNKRISGTVRLSAKQKMAVKKMLRKSHSAGAQMRRAKSMKVRARAGL